jgi:hypothetical protein
MFMFWPWEEVVAGQLTIRVVLALAVWLCNRYLYLHPLAL